MTFDDGYLHAGDWNDAPVRIHWMAPVGAFAFGGFGFAPGAWLGFLVVVLAHELGHAWIVRACDGIVVGIEVTAVGGECHWAGRVTRAQRAVIAWGGVIGQLVLLALVLAASALVPPLVSAAGQDLVRTLTATNVMMALINLIPVEPLDGARAWSLVGILVRDLVDRLEDLPRRSRARRLRGVRKRALSTTTSSDIEAKVESRVATIIRDATKDRPR